MHFCLWQLQENCCMNMSHDDDDTEDEETFESQVNYYIFIAGI